MKHIVIDIETDGLIEDVTKIHCLCYYIIETGEVGSLTNQIDIINFIQQKDIILICHNCIRYDIPVLEKLLSIKITCKLIDTLALSWYLYPTEINIKGEVKPRKKHGLEVWGNYFGVPKPIIKDWSNQSLQDYINRCTEDVKINLLLFNKQKKYLDEIYGVDNWYRLAAYLTFKMDCAREQEEVKWKLDVDLCTKTLVKLEADKLIRLNKLTEVMPKVQKFKTVNKPTRMLKKDGSLSSKAIYWNQLLEDCYLSPSHEKPIEILVSEVDGNPNSSTQIKDWLISLGWKPATFSYVKNKETGEQRKIPQIYGDDGVCKSVELLYIIEPNLKELDTLSILSHRIGILKGFLKNKDKNDYLKAEIAGLTNTLRFMHTTIVNLPTVHKPYGKEVRGSLTSPSTDYLLCGSDMSSLEDNTKQHYMYFYDPKYVKEMRVPGFDPHLDIALQGNMLTLDQVNAHKAGIENHSGVRKDAKQVNFSAVYGVGPPKLSLTTGWSIEKSTKLLEVYWERNWSVKKIAKDLTVKNVDGQMWLYNPISQFWYTLRYDKDRFSTCNQSSGVYAFDTYLRNVRNKGYKMCGQFHDEWISVIHKSQKEQMIKDLNQSIKETNEQLKLNIELGISMDFGLNYAEIH
jgi:hypothetical protein